jgi:hypothetical protein
LIYYGAEQKRLHDAADAFFDRMASSDAAVNFTCLHLNCFGERADTWSRFAERFGPKVTELKLYLTSDVPEFVGPELTRCLGSPCFGSLETLAITSSCSGSATGTVQAVILSVPRSVGIKTLRCRIRCREQNDEIVEREELRCLFEVVTRSRSLSTLEACVSGSNLLEAVLLSESLESVSLSRMQLRLDHQSCASNSTVKRLSLSKCRLDGGHLLSCFKGLEDLKLDDCELDAAPQTFATFERLTKLSVLEVDHWVANAVKTSPSLKEVYVSGAHPALREIVATCSAALTVHDFNEFLIQGIEAATSPNDLTLDLYKAAAAPDPVAPVMKSLQQVSTLLRFVGIFRSDDGGSHQFAPKAFAALPSIIRRNKSLKVLVLRPGDESQYCLDKAESAQIVEALRDSSTALQQIEGLWYDSYEEEVNDLLLLNKYGREMVASRGATVPMDRWGDVLMRISNPYCNYVVTELVRAALAGTGEGE